MSAPSVYRAAETRARRRFWRLGRRVCRAAQEALDVVLAEHFLLVLSTGEGFEVRRDGDRAVVVLPQGGTLVLTRRVGEGWTAR